LSAWIRLPGDAPAITSFSFLSLVRAHRIGLTVAAIELREFLRHLVARDDRGRLPRLGG